ncbi:Small heat shock protein, chloroplastic-like protein [Drosera capensis]
MASSIALKRLTSGGLNSLCRRPVRALNFAPSITRSFNTNTQMTRVDDEGDSLDVDRRPDRDVSRRRTDLPSFIPDAFDPFSPPRTISQLMNLMDQLTQAPFSTLGLPRATPFNNIKRGWDVKEDESALHLQMDMPGLSKEDVKVYVEENTLIIKGEGGKEGKEEESRRRYSTRIELTPNPYKVDEIKAEMKNGVLKVVVPKVKEERRDVFQVNVA